MDIVTAALTLFFVMDPVGNIPLFTSVLSRVDESRRRIVLARELLLALCFLVAFLYVGERLLGLLDLDTDAIRVGGGIVLFLIALRLVFPQQRPRISDEIDGEPLVFPLAVPLIAGPSSMATILLLSQHSTSPARLSTLVAIGCAWGAAAIILFVSPMLLRVVGRRGLMAVERLMGMLLIMMSVQMVMRGLRHYLGGV